MGFVFARTAPAEQLRLLLGVRGIRSAGSVTDFAADRSTGFETGTKVAADRAKGVKAGGYGNAVKFDRQMGRDTVGRHVSSNVDSAVAKRRVAGWAFQGAGKEMVDKAAGGVKIHGRSGGKFGAMNTGGPQAGLDLCLVGRAVKVQLAGEVAAPARIRADQQACKLAELGFAPFEIDMDGHLPQLGGALGAGLEAHQSSAAHVQAEIRAGRLSAQSNPAITRLLLPEGQIGLQQGKGQLLSAVFEVDARVGGFKIGE